MSTSVTSWIVISGVVAIATGACALETALKPGMDKEREAMIAQWKKALASGEQSAVIRTLSEAAEKSNVAFGMSDWPQAVAEAASKAQLPMQGILLGHLRRHRDLINKATSDWIRELFKRDVLDPFGEQVRGWGKADDRGLAAAEAALKVAADGGRMDELSEILDALARCGNARFLPAAVPYLSHENEQVSGAALGVFKKHAKDFGPDVRSPKLCHIWWLQSGREQFENK